jgi:hypothetical protein
MQVRMPIRAFLGRRSGRKLFITDLAGFSPRTDQMADSPREVALCLSDRNILIKKYIIT